MKKEMARLLNLFALIALVAIFSFSFVAAQGSTGNPVIDPLIDLFVFQNLGPSVIKWLYIILLTLLIWSALDASGVVRQKQIKWGISLIISFLAVSYFTPAEVFGLLLTYSALGMTLLFLLPLAILFFFTIRAIMTGGIYGLVAQYFMWILYFIFLVYRFIADIVVTNRLPYDSVSTWVFLAAILVTGAMVFANKAWRKLISRVIIDAETDEVYEKEEKATHIVKARAKAFDDEASARDD